MPSRRPRGLRGSYRQALDDLKNATVASFSNPYNFFRIMEQNAEDLLLWFQKNGLMASSFICERCRTPCRLVQRADRIDGYTWRCRQNSDHEYSVRKYSSFFSRCHFMARDTMLFIKLFLDGLTLLDIAKQTCIHFDYICTDTVANL